MYYNIVNSPIGDLMMVGDGAALTGLYFTDSSHPRSQAPVMDASWQSEDSLFTGVIAQLRAYFAGELTTFDLPLAARGTPFQERVWSALTAIPYGTTTTYGQVAAGLGDAKAVRAVGLANGRNPIPIIIPCHRVIGADGGLTGYGGGIDRKHWLLAREGRALPFA